MSDDSDLMIAAAATAAVVTWLGARRLEHGKAAPQRRDWRALLRAFAAGAARTWRETPAYQFYIGIRDALGRRKDD